MKTIGRIFLSLSLLRMPKLLLSVGFSMGLFSISQAQINTALFKYEKIAHPVFKTDSSFIAGRVLVKEGIYVTADSFHISAYLIQPVEIKNSTPLIIFNHWGEGNKNEFLAEAITFSSSGFICILPDEPWLCPRSKINSFSRQGDIMVRQAVINTQVAIDLAGANYPIDKNHIYVVGHSYGCASGTILSAIEPRINYFIFMTGVYSTTETASNSTQKDFVDWRTGRPEDFNKWITKMKPYDPDLYLPHKKVPCLVQVAKKDEFISAQENKKFIKLTPKPKTVKRYDATHALNEEAREDRMEWVKSKQ